MKVKISDPLKNEERLRKQRLYTMEYQKQMEAKGIESQEPLASAQCQQEFLAMVNHFWFLTPKRLLNGVFLYDMFYLFVHKSEQNLNIYLTIQAK